MHASQAVFELESVDCRAAAAVPADAVRGTGCRRRRLEPRDRSPAGGCGARHSAARPARGGWHSDSPGTACRTIAHRRCRPGQTEPKTGACSSRSKATARAAAAPAYAPPVSRGGPAGAARHTQAHQPQGEARSAVHPSSMAGAGHNQAHDAGALCSLGAASRTRQTQSALQARSSKLQHAWCSCAPLGDLTCCACSAWQDSAAGACGLRALHANRCARVASAFSGTAL